MLSETERPRYSLREEPFGFTLMDKQKLKHDFILREEWDTAKEEKGIADENVDRMPSIRTDFRTDIPYSPIRIYWELTLACNLHCEYCFNDSGKPRPTELTTAEVTEGLSKLRAANVMDVRFTGGELTRRKDWYEILKTAKESGFAVSCNTNGVYMDPSIPEKFASLDLDQVTLSIDGKKETHERNRGKGTFDKTLASLKQMHELGVKLRINTLITKGSVDDLEYMTELASQYTTEINFFITRFVGRGNSLTEADAASYEEFYEMSQRAAELRTKYPNLHILHFEEATVQNSSRSGTYDKFGLRSGPPDGSTRFNITSDGGLWAGGYIPYVDPSYRLGNIKTNDLFDIWQKSPRLEQFREESMALEEYCAGCKEYGTKCPGPNFELELLRKKNPDIKNPYCFYGNGPSLLIQSESKSFTQDQ